MKQTWLTLLLDLSLLLPLLWLGWRIIFERNLHKAVLLFMIFGLVMALIWAHLQAPDVALAEAAIGAGLTGALLLSTLKRLERMS